MNVELVGALVDAIHRTDVHAAPVLYTDAGLGDHERHGRLL